MVNTKMIKAELIKKFDGRKMILNQLPQRELILGRRLLGRTMAFRLPHDPSHADHDQLDDGRAGGRS